MLQTAINLDPHSTRSSKAATIIATKIGGRFVLPPTSQELRADCKPQHAGIPGRLVKMAITAANTLRPKQVRINRFTECIDNIPAVQREIYSSTSEIIANTRLQSAARVSKTRIQLAELIVSQRALKKLQFRQTIDGR